MCIVPLLCLLLILVGCADIVGMTTGTYSVQGRQFPAEKAREIKDGVTTREDLIRDLGRPMQVRELQDGTQVFLWYYEKTNADLGFWFTPMGVGGKSAAKTVSHWLLECEMKDGVVIRHRVEGVGK